MYRVQSNISEMRGQRFRCNGLIGLVLSLLLCPIAARAQEVRPDDLSFWRQYLHQLDRQADIGASSAAPFNRQLLYLADLAPKEHDQRALYEAVLDRLEQADDPSTIPALEALLNVKWTPWPSSTQSVIYSLRDRASKLWYVLKWREALPAVKNKTAFYGLRPHSPVAVTPKQSMNAVLTLGPQVRNELYELLRDSDIDYDAWEHSVSVARTSELLESPVFAPTDAEVEAVLQDGGNFGQAVMIRHLSRRRNPRAIPAIIHWIQIQDDYGRLNHIVGMASGFAQAPIADRSRLVNVLVDLGNRLQNDFAGVPKGISYFRLLSQVNRAVYRLGHTPNSDAYMRQYLKFDEAFEIESMFEYLKAHPRYLYPILDALQWARKFAADALAEWDEK